MLKKNLNISSSIIVISAVREQALPGWIAG